MDSTIVLAVKAPSDCSAAELREFAAFVVAGGEVVAEGLIGRIESAHALIFLQEASCLVGIAALKNPNLIYRASVFDKAGVIQNHNQYPLELGWIFILPSARGKGYSKLLLQAAVAHAGGVNIFATSRTDNPHMHASLLRASFVKHGNNYASKRGTHHLSLFLRNAPAK